MLQKPYSEACDRNREPILHYLKQWLPHPATVLEVGSGTGQHAVYFARHLPHLVWQPSDRQENLSGISLWQQESGLSNVNPPLLLDVNSEWPALQVPVIFSSNTLHIMSWPMVQAFFAGVAAHLQVGGQLIVYGPFNQQGEYTSASNAQFDQWLKARDPASGIRDYAAVDALARQAGLQALDDCAMPANNRLLRWCKH